MATAVADGVRHALRWCEADTPTTVYAAKASVAGSFPFRSCVAINYRKRSTESQISRDFRKAIG